ncbi:MAG: hypothetical protein IPK08_07850 [Bacteroidetes bacterium]|nr:hypothetical protein [Bacteroidota bacterium]
MPTGIFNSGIKWKNLWDSLIGEEYSHPDFFRRYDFEFDISTNTLTKLANDFDQVGGDYPAGGLFETPSGTLIGVTNTGV